MSATGAAPAAQGTLAERFARLFPAAERARGEEFFRQAAIAGMRAERSGWHGSVEGQDEVRLKLNPAGSGLRPSCKCGGRKPCGHAWALLLEVDLLLETAARCAAEHREWFVFERRSKSAIAWKSPAARSEALRLRPAPAAPVARASVELDAQSANPGSPTPVATDAAIPMKAPSPEWQRRLRRLDEPFGGPASCSETSERLSLAYALDPRPDAGTALAVQVLIRHRSRSGALAWLPFDQASPAKAAELDLPDRRIIELARGMVRSWDELLLLRHDSRLVIEDPVQDLMLPLLAATGRARWHDWKQHGATGFDAAPLLELEESAPLLFRARLVQSDARIELRPELWRDGIPCELQRIDAVHGAYLRIGPRLTRLDLGPARRLAVDLLGKGPLQAEASDAEDLLRRLAELPDAERIEGDGIAEQPAPLQVCLCLDAPRDPPGELVLAELSFDYDGTRVTASTRQALVRHGGLLAPRDRAAEQRAVERLREAGGVPALDDRWSLPRAQLHSLLTALLHEGYRIEAEKQLLRGAGTPSLRVRSGIDWFELEAELPFGDLRVPLAQVLATLRGSSRGIELGDGSLGLLPEDLLRGWEALLAFGEQRKGRLRFAAAQSFVLDLLLATTPCELDADARFTERRARLAGFTRIAARQEPSGFLGELRPYQRFGLGWLAFLQETGFGGCLADDMGLGKTVQVLAHLVASRTRAEGRPTLVVAPRSLVFNWRREAARFAPGLAVLEFAGTDRWEQLGLGEAGERNAENAAIALSVFDLVLITYGTLLRDIAVLREVPFHWAVLDEAQTIKNAQSQTAKAARLLRAEQRLALSGTPVENHLDELWSIFEFLNPGMLGRSKAFADFVASSASPDAAALRGALRPFLLRRTKEQVLEDLPPKIEQVLDCELDPVQREYYDTLRDGVRAALLERIDDKGLENSQVQVLTALLRLRQAACHPRLADPKQTAAPSAKLERLLAMLDEVREGGHKALVFSQFTQFLELVRGELETQGLRHAWIDGRTRRREAQVDLFQNDPDCGLFLISLKSGGHGLNLTAADYVFVLDPWWNPAAEAQAIDRAHRLGQTRTVFAYRLIARDTIEEKVMALQAQKRALAAALFDESGGASLRDLTREDLERLLS
ncbi:MAG: DEAD/DEAH box helicase [Planctomycetes bacterium]|nr:DEAD/DEAH box helicase [Planctomycetota bacterium]